jgi:hypothetical protein
MMGKNKQGPWKRQTTDTRAAFERGKKLGADRGPLIWVLPVSSLKGNRFGGGGAAISCVYQSM